MVFSSPVFLFCFLPLTILLYYFGHPKLRNYVLLLASLFFYAWGEPTLVFLMIASIVINYVLALFMDRSGKKGVKTVLLIAAVVLDLGFLFFYKYFNFTVATFFRVTGVLLTARTIALPIGISFYTFQIMSYVIDVYRGNVRSQKNPFYLGLYISMFPQLIAGPIVRYIDVEKQIASRTLSPDKFYEGTLRFMKGFAKKVLIADQLSSFVDMNFEGNIDSALVKWIAIIAYTLQIYYDFSGYSDMAIGLGKIFGFDFVENFNFPYVSQSIKEFWRRWHISLSTWFRDYVYIPLGGSRKGTARTYINLIIVFVLTGFWHGASWNFIFWGLFYAVFLVIERLGFSKILEKLPRVLRHIYAIIIVVLGWVLFRAETMSGALNYYKGLVSPSDSEILNLRIYVEPMLVFVIIAGIILAFPHDRIKAALKKFKGYEVLKALSLFALFILAVCFMTGAGFSPFLYFRF
ncbi:MAG: MBOAT family protein [Clostridiales bacterium]|nr:MBOAT family protein [Clostridiales bacterium]